MKKSQVYAIIDFDLLQTKTRIIKTAREVCRSKVDILQIRAKNFPTGFILEQAFAIKIIAAKRKIPLIINDRLDIAMIVNAEGIHLGKNDIPVIYARSFLGREKIIGLTCNSWPEIIASEKQPIDYFSVGPVFRTPLKPNTAALGVKIMAKVVCRAKKPFFAIGGINRENLAAIAQSGAKHFVFCREIILAKDKIKTVKTIRKIIDENTN